MPSNPSIQFSIEDDPAGALHTGIVESIFKPQQGSDDHFLVRPVPPMQVYLNRLQSGQNYPLAQPTYERLFGANPMDKAITMPRSKGERLTEEIQGRVASAFLLVPVAHGTWEHGPYEIFDRVRIAALG